MHKKIQDIPLNGHSVIISCPLTHYRNQTQALYKLLSEEEKKKADRYLKEASTAEFILSRGLLRLSLAHYLNKESKNIVLSYNPWGKPYLKDKSSTLFFNVSHTQNHTIIALSKTSDIGIDIEKKNRKQDILNIAKRFFTKEEYVALSKTAPSKIQALFYTIWTHKECVIKAIGKGLSFPLSKIHTSLNTKNKLVISEKHNNYPKKTWSITQIPVPKNYICSFTTGAISTPYTLIEL